jgi:hypothetical protein
MATSLISKVDVTFDWNYREIDSASGRTITDKNSLASIQSLADGSLINQADILWSDQRTVNDAANDDLDLAGGLTDAFGNTLTFSLVKGIYVRNRNTTAAENLDIGGGSNTFNTWLGSDGDIVTVGPNGVFMIWNPSLAGYAVTASTGDILRLTGEGGNITYDIAIIGVST